MSEWRKRQWWKINVLVFYASVLEVDVAGDIWHFDILENDNFDLRMNSFFSLLPYVFPNFVNATSQEYLEDFFQNLGQNILLILSLGSLSLHHVIKLSRSLLYSSVEWRQLISNWKLFSRLRGWLICFFSGPIPIISNPIKILVSKLGITSEINYSLIIYIQFLGALLLYFPFLQLNTLYPITSI